VNGVHTDKVPGSRIEYDPFPGGFRIIPGLVHFRRKMKILLISVSSRIAIKNTQTIVFIPIIVYLDNHILCVCVLIMYVCDTRLRRIAYSLGCHI